MKKGRCCNFAKKPALPDLSHGGAGLKNLYSLLLEHEMARKSVNHNRAKLSLNKRVNVVNQLA